MELERRLEEASKEEQRKREEERKEKEKNKDIDNPFFKCQDVDLEDFLSCQQHQ